MHQWTFNEGWLAGAECVPSPNFNSRPAGTPVTLIVIHGISLPPGEFGGRYIDALFTNQLDPDAHPYFTEIACLEVSSHFLIRRCGELVQFVSTDERAWHAGASNWCGREQCNDFSVGIELEGVDTAPYTAAQYDTLGQLVRCLRANYPEIAADAIVGHSDIAPGRKTDPGPAFDWLRLRRKLGLPAS